MTSAMNTATAGSRFEGAKALFFSYSLLFLIIFSWWAISTAGWVSRVFLPSPQATWASLVEGLTDGELLAFSGATVSRMLLGWALASLFGVALGALIGLSTRARAYLQPTLEFIRPLPASALLPLAISIFGLSPAMVLSVVAFGAMWPVLLATVHGFASVPAQLQEVARCLQLSRSAYAFKIGLPNAMPDIFSGMRLSLTVSLIVSVVGEMIASQPGLGQAILLAARSFRASELFAGIVLLGLIGFASSAMLAVFERRFLKWQKV
jgi:sulfonate transport system permease protein